MTGKNEKVKNTRILIILSLMLLAFLVASCMGGNQQTRQEEGIDPADEKIVLDVWHLWVGENDGNAIGFDKAVKAYEADHPGVEIRQDSTHNEAYKTKIKTALSANEAPDVFFSWGAGFAKPFVEAGLVEEISGYLSEETMEKLQKPLAGNFTFDGGLYGLPFVSYMGVLYCNEEMFAQAGVKIPETIDDLYEAVTAFRKQGIVPMALGVKETWTAMFYQNIATMRTTGIDTVTLALNKEASFDSQSFINGAQIVVDLIELGAFDDNAMAYTGEEAKVTFLSGQVPMIFQGSWMSAEIQNERYSDVVDKVVAKNFPGIPGGKYNNQLLGGAIDGFMVSKSSEHKEVAADFVAFISEYMAKESFLNGAGLSPWDIDIEDAEIDPLVEQILELAEESDGYLVAWDTYLSGEDVKWHLELIQEMFAGMIGAEEFAKKMQVINEDPGLE